MKIELQTLSKGYDRESCWVHARVGTLPGNPQRAVVSMQKLRLSGDDVFQGLHDMTTMDGGATWSAPKRQEGLVRRPTANGMEEGISDFSPGWHAASGTLLGTGHTVLYHNDELPPLPRPRSTVYSSYDPDSGLWADWRKLVLPDEVRFESEGAGCTQRWDLPSGEVLLPTYFSLKETVRGNYDVQNVVTVLRCAFDGSALSFCEQGSEMTVPEGRGFVEPSLTSVRGRYFLTLRNDRTGYVTSSPDGLQFEAPRPWTFDDGSDLGNYNTQQHWVTHRDDLYLVYTRKGAGNDHVMRHRAPLFIAQVNPDRLCVIRDTEKILVPERGARLGNFGVAKINEDETWVTVSEWMQTTQPDPFDFKVCERYGSDNSVFLAKIKFGADL